jgi:hypothetical protein
MRFLQVIFLAMWQLTAIPFMAVLSANSMKPAVTSTASANETVIYKLSAN